jgi:C-terminal processing protease CtpA/Prc
MFRQVAADSARTLIVDLRVNGGGDPAFGNEVLRYVTSTPYRNRSRREVKRSRELRDFAKSEISAPLRILPLKYLVPDARRLYAGAIGTLAVWPEPPLRTPKRAEPFFDGRVCVLTGPRTFSAAVILADTIKTYRLAALVGEETGGRPNMYGEWLAYALPRSGLVASIATARSVRANGDAGDRTGVIPDIVVKTTATDIRAGRDPVLARARDCPAVHG